MKPPKYKIKCSAIIKIYQNKDISRLIKESIKKDVNEPDDIIIKNNSLIMNIHANDVSELRAKLASHSRAAILANKVISQP
tara:strand:- start:273 stop:515 length:243 start_codon:yes stop_codon:yes gene_type:complete